MASDPPLKPELWVERPPEETLQVYEDWAESYDTDLEERGYATPRRIASMLARHLPPADTRPILDFGCGTGVSGAALMAEGLAPLQGCDISPAMVDKARPKGLYERLWVAPAGSLDAGPGTYRAIVAAGVVSLGAAPPETMDLLIGALAPGDLLAMSFNDPTLAHGGYDAHLGAHLDDGRLTLLDRAHGPHLANLEMGSDVMVLRRA